ncbi:MAG: hypothetical protein CL946_12950 [Ectothiorhodospiraceae bacterium]|nr:hypothetical protein [Ectothiorhodospiraceae bacterium]
MHSNLSEMLHAYLDGELNGTEEQVLFQELSRSDDLRGEMRDLVAIRNAVNSEKHSMVPPMAATTAVFTGLGFSVPSGASGMAPVPVPTTPPPPVEPGIMGTMGSVFGNISRPLLKPLAGAIVGSALTATVVTTINNNNAADEAAMHQQQQMAESPPIEIVYEAPATPQLSDLFIDVNDKPNRTAEANEVTAAVSTDQSDEQTTAVSLPASASNELAVDDQKLQRSVKEVEDFLTLHTDPHEIGKRRVFVQILNAPLNESNRDSKLGVGAQDFMNMRGGIFYRLSENHLIGLEAGKENFPQLFSGKYAPGRTVSYDQNPTKVWITAAYRYQTGELSMIPGLRGFLQTNAGGALELGGLGRGIVGVQYDLAPGLLIQVGAEGSMLIYEFQDTWFTTSKYGLNYGFALQF